MKKIPALPIGQERCMICGDKERRHLSLKQIRATPVTDQGDALCLECGARREFVLEPDRSA